jgi:hypothetical protein
MRQVSCVDPFLLLNDSGPLLNKVLIGSIHLRLLGRGAVGISNRLSPVSTELPPPPGAAGRAGVVVSIPC